MRLICNTMLCYLHAWRRQTVLKALRGQYLAVTSETGLPGHPLSLKWYIMHRLLYVCEPAHSRVRNLDTDEKFRASSTPQPNIKAFPVSLPFQISHPLPNITPPSKYHFTIPNITTAFSRSHPLPILYHLFQYHIYPFLLTLLKF